MLPNNKSGFKLMLRSLSDLVKEGNYPSAVIRAVLARWMAQVTPGLIRHSPNSELAKQSAIAEFADWLKDTDILTAAFWLSSAYAALLDKSHRKASAMYFTPPHLSSRILDNAGEYLFLGKIIDPACGGAAFLAPAALRISAKLCADGAKSEEILTYIENHLFGVDTDQFLCELSATFLRMILAEHIRTAGREPKLNVRCEDGLREFADEKGTFQLVLCNPPYRKLNKLEITPYLESYGHIVRGQPNLYTLFFCKAVELLAPDGSAVLLTPMSFLSGQSFSKLRKFLVTCGNVIRLDLIHDKQGVFLGAEQDAVITTWRKTQNRNDPADVFSLTSGGGVNLSGKLVADKSGTPWPTPRIFADSEFLLLFGQRKHDLQSYGYTVRTGSIVVHRDSKRRYKTLKTAQSKCLVPMIWQGDIKPDGSLSFGKLPKKRDRYVEMGALSSVSLVKKPAIAMQRVTSDSQKRRLVCAPVPSDVQDQFGGVVGENHVCFIESLFDSPIVSHALLCSILRTETLDRLFRCISGATNVSAYELMQLPLPDPAHLTSALAHGSDIEEATRVGYGLGKCS